MEGHTRSWDAVAADMTRTLGERFEPEWKEGLHERIVRQLTHELPQLDQTTIGKAVDRAVGEVRFPIDWRRFLCFLLYHLPGQWVKVANNPGFGASTMLLLTDGTVIEEEAEKASPVDREADLADGAVHGLPDRRLVQLRQFVG